MNWTIVLLKRAPDDRKVVSAVLAFPSRRAANKARPALIATHGEGFVDPVRHAADRSTD